MGCLVRETHQAPELSLLLRWQETGSRVLCETRSPGSLPSVSLVSRFTGKPFFRLSVRPASPRGLGFVASLGHPFLVFPKPPLTSFQLTGTGHTHVESDPSAHPHSDRHCCFSSGVFLNCMFFFTQWLSYCMYGFLSSSSHSARTSVSLSSFESVEKTRACLCASCTQAAIPEPEMLRFSPWCTDPRSPVLAVKCPAALRRIGHVWGRSFSRVDPL